MNKPRTTCFCDGYREAVDVQHQVMSEARHVDQDVNRAWELPRGQVRVKQDSIALRVREGGDAEVSLPRLPGDPLRGRGGMRSCWLGDWWMRFVIFVYATQHIADSNVNK